jgi:hypothetical protein
MVFFARGISPGQAKTGDELFWEEIFHAPNGEAQVCTHAALLFFLLSLDGGGEREGRGVVFIFPWFLLYYL